MGKCKREQERHFIVGAGPEAFAPRGFAALALKENDKEPFNSLQHLWHVSNACPRTSKGSP